MAPGLLERSSKKRKLPTLDSAPPPVQELPEDVGLEMESGDEEGEESANGEDGNGLLYGSDDGSVDEFPEIHSGDSEEEEDEEESESEDEDEDEEDEEDVSEDDSSSEGVSSDTHPFPRPKTIISNITGQPKRVYPEIEPDYDSDSSTEDVRVYNFSSF